MPIKLKIEQVSHRQDPNVAKSPWFNFPISEITNEVQIIQIMVSESSEVPLEKVEWLLLQPDKRGYARLFIRGYQDPAQEVTQDRWIKTDDLDLLRFEPSEEFKDINLVWRLKSIQDLDQIKPWYRSRWQRRAVLVLIQGDSPGEYRLLILNASKIACEAYCCPPETRLDEWICWFRGCEDNEC